MLFRIRIHYSSIRVTIADLADFRREKHFWPEYTLTNAGPDVQCIMSKIIQAEEMPKAEEFFQAVLNAGRIQAEEMPLTRTDFDKLLADAANAGIIQKKEMPKTDVEIEEFFQSAFNEGIIQEMPETEKNRTFFGSAFQTALNAGRFPCHMTSQKRFSGIFRAALNPERFPCTCSDCCHDAARA